MNHKKRLLKIHKDIYDLEMSVQNIENPTREELDLKLNLRAARNHLNLLFDFDRIKQNEETKPDFV